jgi:hypothetical protein
LTFRFENIEDWLATNEKVSAIQLLGNCSNISVAHCRFEHVIKALGYYPLRDGDIGDHIELSDCEIKHTDQNAIALRFGLGGSWGYNLFPQSEPLGRLIHVNIFRNNVYDIGHRPSPGEACHAIEIKGGELVNIAYNIVDRTYAGGIQAINNRWSGQFEKFINYESPLNRCLIHHNKVTNTMLQGNDWGSISSWGVGPSYVYNNISGNCMGHRYSYYKQGWPMKHEFHSFFSITNSNFGIAFYFDHMYKGYCFNNIAWGKENDIEQQYYSTFGYFQTRGPLNHVFHNTFYRFAVGTMTFYNNFRCFGNLYLDIGYSHLSHGSGVVGLTAYTNNAFQGDVKKFALGGGQQAFNQLSDWQQFLENSDAMASHTGIILNEENVHNAADHDFQLRENEPGVDQGVKVFVPWGLYKVAGEWNFLKDKSNPTNIYDEHFYLNDEYIAMMMFAQIPRHDLTAHNIKAGDFESGLLEDWAEGALNFNGRDQYCSIPDESTKADYSWKTETDSGSYSGSKRITLDAGMDNFLIEVVFKTIDHQTGGTLVSKGSEQQGYHLALDPEGKAQLRLGFGQDPYKVTSQNSMNDDQWHHLVAEIDRDNNKVRIYIDGNLESVKEKGVLKKGASLTNTDDFTVGRLSLEEANFFQGKIDFLRISKGTLTDAETTIEELYSWQFDGPFLKDFLGRKPNGSGRDIGALEAD